MSCARRIGAHIPLSLHPMVNGPAILGQVLEGLVAGVVPGRGAEGPAKRARGGLRAGHPRIPDLAILALDILQHQQWGHNALPLKKGPRLHFEWIDLLDDFRTKDLLSWGRKHPRPITNRHRPHLIS